MSDCSTTSLFPILLGGVLTAVGGFGATTIRARLDKKQQISDIKICVIDELKDISSILAKMLETYNQTKNIYNKYLNSLKSNSLSLSLHQQKLFLIADDDLRTAIRNFYKDLNDNIEKSINTVGTLQTTPEESAIQADSEVINNFKLLATKADNLITDVKAYTYKAYFIF